MLKFLGVGSCFNTEMGNTSAYYVENGKLTLFDAGETVFDAIMRKNLLEGVKNVDVFITHLHSDHVGSLPSLIFYLHFFKNINPTIWFPNDDIVKFLDLVNVPRELYNFMIPIDNNKFIYVIKQKHTIVKSAYGYVIKIKGKWIYYSGDTNEFNLNLKRAFDGLWWSDKEIVISQIYHDGTRYLNDAHININSLVTKFPKDVRKYITIMHFDDEQTIDIAKNQGFKIATVE